MTIARFPITTPIYDEQKMTVIFVAISKDNTIQCAISLEALMDHFENDRTRPSTVFSKYRSKIVAIADRLVLLGRFEADGTILIRSSDC